MSDRYPFTKYDHPTGGRCPYCHEAVYDINDGYDQVCVYGHPCGSVYAGKNVEFCLGSFNRGLPDPQGDVNYCLCYVCGTRQRQGIGFAPSGCYPHNPPKPSPA